MKIECENLLLKHKGLGKNGQWGTNSMGRREKSISVEDPREHGTDVESAESPEVHNLKEHFIILYYRL